jgi:protein-tyrosine phosphatase/membrane-associated phospholipid phosphatase
MNGAALPSTPRPGEVSRRPWRRAFVWLAFLAPFFFATYGFATWVTARRAEVGALVFEWERHIPFVPWTIVPYWSIDLLYGISLFVCATRRELDIHVRRLLTAQVIAVACFLAFPLRFTFVRPAIDGPYGWMFDVLGSFDKPFNQAPSLHIALMVILWAVYARHVARPWRPLVHGWFFLIGASVLTTWQHHFIDVPTGLLLGYFCLWLWPLEARSPLANWALTRDPQRLRLALRYGAASLLAGTLAFGWGGAALWLLWAAVALLFVSLNYLALGTDGFQKRDGRLSPAAHVLLLPYVVGAWINTRAWTRGKPPLDRVADDVWIGRLPTPADLDRHAIAAIVDLNAELPVAAAGRMYVNLPVLDLVPPDPAVLAIAATEIERLRSYGPVLVCCALGYSRSASAVAAWLVTTGRAADVDVAVELVRQARPAIVLAATHRAQVDDAVRRNPAAAAAS